MAISKVNSPYTKIQDVPDVPTIGTATEGAESAEIAFTPAVTGGKAYQYRALSSPGGIEAISPSSPILIEGLTADISYNFQVRAESNTGATNGYSSASNSIVPTASSAYDLLETTVLGSDTASVSFTNLSSYSNYKHLQLRIVGQNTSNAPGTIFATFNSDTGNNYSTHRFYGNGSSVNSDAFTSRANLFMGHVQDPNPTDAFAGSVVDILDPFSTTKNTTTRTLSGNVEPNFPNISIHSGLYVSTNAITSIELVPNETNFGTGSRFSLYGIKAA